MAKLSLDERISAIRAEIDTLIDERAHQIAQMIKNVPFDVIRATLVAEVGCQCGAYTALVEKGELS